MDLYADLPLAKGASTALDADGKPKNPVSVWAKGVPVAPPSAGRGKVFVPPSVQAGGGNSTTRAKSPSGGVSFAFKPASIARKANTSIKSTPANAFSAPVTAREPSPKTETQSVTPTQRTGLGFVAATTWTQVTVQKENHPSTENAAASAGESGSHFFQVTYRDEYHPSRPNSYEAFCDERTAKEKMEQVKRDLERRQREQDKESKREREQLLKDVVEGKASSVPLQASAGRGRGMTVPAWMRKKIIWLALEKLTTTFKTK
ncbi:hypothetical protein Poli38472_002244 [Pythium oligandrum]|uniref:Uncharacterized protein n=1 Tax=Pythium oligandrum TaxID=41045 RepID=A0A8K1CHY1_PYTOL|nr:hypothetical protein Poli38472_002244 [Pythium oligandrum]|eukprot:TMW63303.1 hypothetical protein Poli38472_002244 [Pythium oligandrum]